MTDMSALDAQQRAGVIAIYFAPNIPPRTSAALIVEHLGGLKRYAWYWLHQNSWTPNLGGPALIPDWRWTVPDHAIRLWSES